MLHKTRHTSPARHPCQISPDWPVTDLWITRPSRLAYPLAASRLLINFLIFHISTFLSALDSPSIPFVAIPTGWHSHFFHDGVFLPISVWFSSIRQLSNSPPVFSLVSVYVKIDIRLVESRWSSCCQFTSVTYQQTRKFSPPCAMF